MLNKTNNRIERLKEERAKLNEDMKHPFDPWIKQDAIEQYNVVSRELTWLLSIESHFIMPFQWNRWEQRGIEVWNWLYFEAAQVSVPLLNHPIQLKPGQYVLTYMIPDVVEDKLAPARYTAESINHRYISAQPELAKWREVVIIVNEALQQINAPRNSKDFETYRLLCEAAGIYATTPYEHITKDGVTLPYREQLVEDAISQDHLFSTFVKGRAGELWPDVRRALLTALQSGMKNVDFELKFKKGDLNV